MAVGRSQKIVNSIADSCTANNNVNMLTLNLYFNSRTLLLKRGQQGRSQEVVVKCLFAQIWC